MYHAQLATLRWARREKYEQLQPRRILRGRRPFFAMELTTGDFWRPLTVADPSPAAGGVVDMNDTHLFVGLGRRRWLLRECAFGGKITGNNSRTENPFAQCNSTDWLISQSSKQVLTKSKPGHATGCLSLAAHVEHNTSLAAVNQMTVGSHSPLLGTNHAPLWD